MRAEHAALLANAVRVHLWDDVRVCPPQGGWSTVRGEVIKGGVSETPGDFIAGQPVATDELHLVALDFAPYTAIAKPTRDWWVSYVDLGGVTQLRRVATPFQMLDGQFMSAPLKPVDPADQPPA